MKTKKGREGGSMKPRGEAGRKVGEKTSGRHFHGTIHGSF